MKIALINISSERPLRGKVSSDGAHLISALLKRADHSVKLVLLARSGPFVYERNEFERLNEILKDVDLVMVSAYTPGAVSAAQLTELIHQKYPGVKVVWGGPHCIGAPELSLRHADGICFSEGDECVVQFVNKLAAGDQDYLKTPNMAFNIQGSPVVNDVLPPFEDLDSLPFTDYSLQDHFLQDKHLFPLTKENVRNYCITYSFGRPVLVMVTSRGCPHRCSFCNNACYIALFGHSPIRFQSVGRFMDELEAHLNHLDFFDRVGFADDDFFLRPKEQLEEFAQRYKAKVGLPFFVNVSANTYSKEKMEILLDAGLRTIQMGTQSASQRVLDEVYDRKIKVTKTKEVLRQIEPYQKTHGLKIILDFIIDNPYETRDDIVQSYQYISELSPQVDVHIYGLAFFPGTPIYKRAVKDGIIEPYDVKVFRRFHNWAQGKVLYQRNYETLLILLAAHLRRAIPRFILRILGSSPVRGIASILPKSLYPFLMKALGGYLLLTNYLLRRMAKSH